MLNGCLTQLSFVFGSIVFVVLALLAPAIGNVFEDIQSELVPPPPMLTPTNTFVPATATDEPTVTATFTLTATATETDTPTETAVPTNTATSTPTSTPTNTTTATATFTPSFTPTPAPLCSVQNNRNALINVRTEAFAGSELVAQLPVAAQVDVYAISEQADPDGYLWYYIETELDGNPVAGWVREDVVTELTPCAP